MARHTAEGRDRTAPAPADDDEIDRRALRDGQQLRGRVSPPHFRSNPDATRRSSGLAIVRRGGTHRLGKQQITGACDVAVVIGMPDRAGPMRADEGRRNDIRDRQLGIEVARHGECRPEHHSRPRGIVEAHEYALRPGRTIGADDEHRHASVTQELLARLTVVPAGKVATKNQQVRIELVDQPADGAPRLADSDVELRPRRRQCGREPLEGVHRALLVTLVPVRKHPHHIDAGGGPGVFPGPANRAKRWWTKVHGHQYPSKIHATSLWPGGLPPRLHSMQVVASGMAMRRANGTGFRQATQIP